MMAAYKILFVDDDPSILKALGSYFEKLGHEVHRAHTGEVGLRIHERVHPDVTILDDAMPGMSGLDMLAALRGSQAMVIMLTGMGQIETAVEAMRLGAENFLVKPVDLDHLGIAVEKAVEKAVLRKENVKLRRRVHPALKRRMMRAALVVLLVAASASLGFLIGDSGQAERVRDPIPVDSAR